MNKYISKPVDLITTHEETRAGFIAFALEKNRKSSPYIEQARALKVVASKTNTPAELKDIKDIQSALLSAAGLSDKSLKYFNETDKKIAVEELINNFLEPAGKDYVEELVYRYLLIKGDSLGGSMRNAVGAIGQQKFVRSLLSMLRVLDIPYQWIDARNKNSWIDMTDDDLIVEENIKAISWNYNGSTRVLGFNITIPIVKKNVDLCLFNVDTNTYIETKVQNTPESIILLGELKGGIDPAGADEHWKTANSALRRIRDAFTKENLPIKTIFIGAAIENAMAVEIFNQLTDEELNNAANLTNENQLAEICNWIISL